MSTILEYVEVTHTYFTKVTRVEFIHVDTVVVLTSSITATTGVFAVFADTTVTGGDVASLLAVFGKSGWHSVVLFFG
jgi:hypothetical protein